MIVVNNTEATYKELKQYLSQLSDRLDKGSQEYILDLVGELCNKWYEIGWEEYKLYGPSRSK